MYQGWRALSYFCLLRQKNLWNWGFMNLGTGGGEFFSGATKHLNTSFRFLKLIADLRCVFPLIGVEAASVRVIGSG